MIYWNTFRMKAMSVWNEIKWNKLINLNVAKYTKCM